MGFDLRANQQLGVNETSTRYFLSALLFKTILNIHTLWAQEEGGGGSRGLVESIFDFRG